MTPKVVSYEKLKGIMTAKHTLSCGHVITVMGCAYKANLGDEAWCPTCYYADKQKDKE